MSPTCMPLVKYQAALGEAWFFTLFKGATLCAALLDPRPDLAVPARSVKLSFLWWW
jgi:hypothetical protein